MKFFTMLFLLLFMPFFVRSDVGGCPDDKGVCSKDTKLPKKAPVTAEEMALSKMSDAEKLALAITLSGKKS